jgi:hypothetical protein
MLLQKELQFKDKDRLRPRSGLATTPQKIPVVHAD